LKQIDKLGTKRISTFLGQVFDSSETVVLTRDVTKDTEEGEIAFTIDKGYGCYVLVSFNALYIINPLAKMMNFKSFVLETNLDKFLKKHFNSTINLKEFSSFKYNITLHGSNMTTVYRQDNILEFYTTKSNLPTLISYRTTSDLKKLSPVELNGQSFESYLLHNNKMVIFHSNEINFTQFIKLSCEEIMNYYGKIPNFNKAILRQEYCNHAVYGRSTYSVYTEEFTNLATKCLGKYPEKTTFYTFVKVIKSIKDLKTFERLIDRLSLQEKLDSKKIFSIIMYLAVSNNVAEKNLQGPEFEIENLFRLLKLQDKYDMCIAELNKRAEEKRQISIMSQKKQLAISELLVHVSMNPKLVSVFREIKSLSQEEFLQKNQRLSGVLCELVESLYSWTSSARTALLEDFGI
jgi:hypothetical protein